MNETEQKVEDALDRITKVICSLEALEPEPPKAISDLKFPQAQRRQIISDLVYARSYLYVVGLHLREQESTDEISREDS